MSTEAGKLSLGHICMDDGTEYDISLSYLKKDGSTLPCKEGFRLNADTLNHVQQLIKTVATAHARKAGKDFHDLKIIQLNDLGAVFDTEAPQSHDFALASSEKKDALATCDKVSDVWKKTSELLVQSYQEFPSTDKSLLPEKEEPSSDPTTTITLKREDPPGYTPPPSPSPSYQKPSNEESILSKMARFKQLLSNSLKNKPSAPPEEILGRDISEKIETKLQDVQHNFILSHLTPVAEAPIQAPWYKRLWNTTPAPSEPSLAPLEETPSFGDDLEKFIEEIVTEASDCGLQGQLQALGKSYDALLDHLTSIHAEESRHKEAIAQSFKKKANALTKEKAAEIKKEPRFSTTIEEKIDALLALSQKESGSLAQETPALTRAYLLSTS